MLLTLTVNVLIIHLVIGQENQGFNLDEYEEVPSPKPTGFGALEKCGEGSSAGKFLCVPYYRCDGTTNTIIEDESPNIGGVGLLDIRFGANLCEEYLDVCCEIPKKQTGNSSPKPPTSTQKPNPKPSEDSWMCGIRNENGIDFKITGNSNNEAEYGEFPWMVAIIKKYEDNGQQLICGGSLIAPNVVLTGAHCVYNKNIDDIGVRVGEWDTQTKKERLPYQERNIKEIIVHEYFKPSTLFNDIALLILEKPIQEEENVGTICLPAQEITEPLECFATGWGKDAFGNKGNYQSILKKIQLPLVPHDECEQMLRKTRLGKRFILDDSFTCAGGKGKDTCTGDGGSPLVCKLPNQYQYVQVGIVAWGIECGLPGVPGVYADVYKLKSWIEDKLQHKKR